MSILLGNGAGHFNPARYFLAGSGPYSVAVGDFNGDGKQDLTVANQGGNVSILLGNGAGNFSPAANFGAGNSPTSVAVGDFNGDGRQDLAVTNDTSNTVSILVGNCPVPTLGNYPATSVPLSTNTTVEPDAAPINAASMTVSTSTDFNGTLEGDPTTGGVRVTDAHPAGTYTITVRPFGSNGETTTATFNLTVTTPDTCNPVSFGAPTSFAVGNRPDSAVVGDFNGDGKQDLAIIDNPVNVLATLSILLGNGAGGFSAPTTFSGVSFLTGVFAVGDFNGDGKQDVAAVANSFSVAILLGDGTGSFGPARSFGAGGFPDSIAVGDFNRDGKQDLAVANNTGDNVSILLGDGIGGFSVRTNFAVGNLPFRVAVGDFNGDDKQDLAVLRGCCPDGLSILLGDGMGGFSPANNISVGDSVLSLAVGDFNGDGTQDLAVANQFSQSVLILLGDGTGGFSAGSVLSDGGDPYYVTVGDFNGDGRQDLAVANAASNDVSIFLGNGTGDFSAATNFGVGPILTR